MVTISPYFPFHRDHEKEEEKATDPAKKSNGRKKKQRVN